MWRKVALHIWSKPRDPTIYGIFETRADHIIEYIKLKREKEGERITLTHFVGKVVAETLAKHREYNLIIKRGKIVQRDTIDIFFQVEFGGGELSGAKIKEADKKKLKEIAKELREKATKIKKFQDDPSVKLIKIFSKLPPPILNVALRISEFLSYEMGISIGGLDIDPFGSAMVTNIGSFGLDSGLAPLFPLSRTPIVITLGVVKEKPWVSDGELTVKPVLNMGVAIDHRYYDGYHIAVMARTFRELLEKPNPDW